MPASLQLRMHNCTARRIRCLCWPGYAWALFLLTFTLHPDCTSFSSAQGPDTQPVKTATARELYSQAATALLSKDIPKATNSLALLVEQHPGDEMAPLAAMRLAQCYMSAAKTSEAIAVLEKWLPELAKSTKSRTLDPAAELDAQSLLARAYLNSAQYDRVIQLNEQVKSTYTAAASLSDAQRRALEQIKSFSAAAVQRRDAGQAGPLREAAKLVRDKRFAVAQAELAKVDAGMLSADWKWRYHVLTAQCQLGVGQSAKASAQLNLIDLNGLQPKEQAAVRMLRLEAALASGALTPAEKELDALSAIATTDENQTAILDLRRTELALLRKDRQTVERLARSAREKYSKFESLHEFDLMLARNLLARIEFDEARRVLSTLIANPPVHDPTAVPRAQWLIGESYLLSQDYQRASAAYTQVIESGRAPVWSESALIQRGKCYELLGQTKEAQRDYERLTSEYPNSSLKADAQARLSQLTSGQASLR